MSGPAPFLPALRAPRRNRILASLPRHEYERLLPHLEPVSLPAGWTIHGPGERERHLYFPTSGLACRFHLTADGAYTGFAVTGAEGIIGIASFLGAESTLSQTVVLCAGEAYRLGVERLRAGLEGGSALTQLLLRYIQAVIAQTGQVAGCARHHSLKQRTCFWILSCVDRLDSGELPVTHDVIAQIVGVRREGITHAIGQLQREDLIRCHRGGISIFDRAGLEAQACECYAAVRREHTRLLRRPLRPEIHMAA